MMLQFSMSGEFSGAAIEGTAGKDQQYEGGGGSYLQSIVFKVPHVAPLTGKAGCSGARPDELSFGSFC